MLKRRSILLLAVALGVAGLRCGQAILTAPAGSTLRMTANPPFIQAHGGVSVLSVVVIEPAGTVVPDGTVVQFFTTLGRIDEQGRTNDGVARVNLLSTGLSGEAVVTAVSGGPGPAPTTGPTTRPTETPGPSPEASPRFALQAPFASAEGTGQVSVTVAIGNALPASLVVIAEPTRVTAQRPARIRAFVVDADGNPVANVPIFFKLRTPTATERLDSGGAPVFTDNNGVAEDVLRTTAPATAPPRTVFVDATAPNSVTGSAVLTVN